MRGSLMQRRDRSKVFTRPRRDANPFLLLLALSNPSLMWRSGQHYRVGNHPNRKDVRRDGRMSLADAVPPVRWMKIDTLLDDAEPRGTVMPLYPLEDPHAILLPFRNATLHLTEPHDLAMIRDIIASGARRFAVCRINDDDSDSFTETAVVYYLQDLEFVESSTSDRVEYIADVSVIGRVKLVRVLNPRVYRSKETILRAEIQKVVDIEQDSTDSNASAAEAELKETFAEFVRLQDRLGDTPRISPDASEKCSFERPSAGAFRGGLWKVVRLWQLLLNRRAMRTVDKAFDRIDMSFDRYCDDEIDNKKFRTLLDTIYQEMKDDLEITQSRQDCDAMLALLQSTSHSERLSIFRRVLDEEYRRLKVVEGLRSMSVTASQDQ
eukprot:CAMPEP_0169068130 /NCGR_PEP_ID=MMETSP1015-20121227/3856_1 /TAXON_ID=342587 /ORGANISM="Karlodinium micrum, Strain CCMP2283" /LENGTH=379 /DNA_ID=CAMNT_0009126917 /DNA_START=1 /DNA_END=1141 /DNA_ORIENTATION=+